MSEFEPDVVRKVLNALEVVGELTHLEIARATGLDPDVVLAALVELEREGRVGVLGHRLEVE